MIPFTLTIGLGLLAVDVLQKENLVENKQEISVVKVVHSETGTGISGRSETGLPPFYFQESSKTSNLKTDALKIISKSRPLYTDAARQNQVQGIVRLRVNFLASGQIGEISPIINLPDGLTEQAIIAARQIKFKPAMRNGKSITVLKIVEYNFALY